MGTDKRARQKAGHAARREAEAVAHKQQQRRRTFTSAAVVVVVVLAIFGLLALFNKDDDTSDTTTKATTTTVAGASTTSTVAGTPGAFSYGSAACPATDGSAKATLTFESAPRNCLAEGKTYTATFDTTAGKVVVDLATKTSPGTANNFIFLSRYHYYDGTDLFRVAKSIDIIQGGSPHTQTNSDLGPGYTIPDEGGPYTYAPGDLVMARTSEPNSAGAQFFFATGANTANLNSQGTYVVFGHVSEGLDILQKIVATAKDSSGGDQTPDPAVTVRTVTISER